MSITFSLVSPHVAHDGALVMLHGCNIPGCPCQDTSSCPEMCDEFGWYHICDHTAARRDACPVRQVEVNVSNSNATLVLERLGYTFDYCGTVDADDLLGRAMCGNVGRDDTGVAPSEDRFGGARVVDCGLRPGYFDDTLSRLVTLALFAQEHNAQVGWC